jgi:hypothetical protein
MLLQHRLCCLLQQLCSRPGRSREALAVWTPIGLVHPTVLPFGQKNSGTEAQGPYRQAARSLRNVANYVDGWLGYEDSIEALIESFRKFLEVCEAANITLNTSKTKVEYDSAQFFGFIVDKLGTRLADKHRDLLKAMAPPTDISELRGVLGLFVVSCKYIKDYACLTKPLMDVLKGKLPVFRWGKEQQDAYELVRDKLLSSIHLVAPDFELPFHLQMDVSEDGKGEVLYQLPTIPIAEQYHTPRARTVRRVWPSSYSTRRRGTMHRETARPFTWRRIPYYGVRTKRSSTPSRHVFRCTRIVTTCHYHGCGRARKVRYRNSSSSSYRSSRRSTSTFKGPRTPS